MRANPDNFYPDANTGYSTLAPNDVQEYREIQGTFYSSVDDCQQEIYKGIDNGELELISHKEGEGVTFLAWYEVTENPKTDGIYHAKFLSRRLKANIEFEY